MTPDSFETYTRIESQIAVVSETLARVETKLMTICATTNERRQEQRDEHSHCQDLIHKRLNEHEGVHVELRNNITDLSVKWKVAAGLISAFLVALTALNVILSLGVKL